MLRVYSRINIVHNIKYIEYSYIYVDNIQETGRGGKEQNNIDNIH